MIVSRRGSELQHANIHSGGMEKKKIKHDQNVIVTDLPIFRREITRTPPLAPASAFELMP